jgi:protein SCO1/2
MDRRDFLKKPAKSTAAEMDKRTYFTNALLTNHEGKQFRFYDDLMKGKIAIINMMYASCEGICPTMTSNLMKVQEGLKDRIGRDTFMYSITLKPEQDDPAALKHYVHMHGVKAPGWFFLTGDPDEIETIRFRLFRWDHPGIDNNVEQHTGMLFIYNDAISRSAKTPGLSTPQTILRSISWMDPMPVQIERAKRDAYKERDRLRKEAAWARGEDWAKDAVKVGRKQ